jgi:cytoskeletal protein CcmA (bactofilin family)
MKWLLASVFIVFALLLPATASADDGRDDKGFTLRITGDVTVAKGETVGAVVVIDGTATIDGTVTDTLFVINGTAIINGTVQNDVTVISGTLDLRSGARVESVNLFDSNLIRADGVTVTGAIEQSDGFEVPAGVLAALSVYFWVAMTLAVVVAGIVFAAIGGRQLNEATRVFTGQPSNALIGTIAFWVVVPTLAVITMLTLVGIPLGIGVLLFVLPAFWFLGYIVAGAAVGKLILHRSDNPGRPLAATALGLVLLQLGLIVPVVGGIVAFLAGIWGAGALAFIAYRAAGGKGFSPEGPAPVATQTPSPAM